MGLEQPPVWLVTTGFQFSAKLWAEPTNSDGKGSPGFKQVIQKEHNVRLDEKKAKRPKQAQKSISLVRALLVSWRLKNDRHCIKQV